MKRKIYEQLLRWKNESAPETALLIEGARRVGKSWIVEEFAKCEYRSFVLIDFNKVSKAVIDFFKNDLEDLDVFFRKLSEYYGVRLYEGETLFVFDEVQEFPRARAAIKYLVEDGRYHFIETGSLMSIAENVTGIVIPSEEDSIKMFPLDFEEFLWATGRADMVETIKSHRRDLVPFGAVHRKMIEAFREYLVVGGMPQAVDTYLDTNNFEAVDRSKRLILDLYDEDFGKIDPSGKAARIFAAIPAQLNSNASRYQISGVIAGASAEDYVELISEMEKSMTVNISHHCDDPNVGLGANEDLRQYKMFTGDTGLFVTLAFKDKAFTENVIYERLLSDKLPANLGYLYENMLAQMLTASGNKLFYHTWPTESGKHNYEIDFLLSRGTKITPVEVKSSTYKTHVSLDHFCEKYPSRITNERYLVYTKDYAKEGPVKYLPAYMAYFL